MRKWYLPVVAVTVVLAAWMTLRAADDAGEQGVKVGAATPQFTLPDQDGKDVSLKDYQGKVVVLEWTNPHCPYVLYGVYKAKIMQNLAAKYGPDGVAWVAINSTKGTTNESDKQWATDQGIDYPVLNDVGTQVGKDYHATNTPEMFIIGKDGTLLYKGAIDNDPEGDKTSGKVNYVQQSLDEILAGKTVSQPETKPYGCGVKYAN